MTNAEKVRLLLQRTMTALGPYRSEVVLIGGFAKTLYRHLPEFHDLGMIPQATLDVDLALPEPLLLRDERTLHERLEANGLRRFVGLGLDNRPAFHRYHLAEDGVIRKAVVYLEFIVPLHGPERTTPGRPQTDLLAHALRFIDLLQAAPVTVADPDLGSVRLPHPLAYAIQKTRIWRERSPAKADRDQADAFFVIGSLRAAWPAWKSEWRRLREHQSTWARWLSTTQEHWCLHYQTADTAGCRSVSSLTGMDARMVHAIMEDFLRTVCAPPSSAT